jgi:hypothetical protein
MGDLVEFTQVCALAQGQGEILTWPTPAVALSWIPAEEAGFTRAMESPYPEVTNHQLDRLGALAASELRRSLQDEVTQYYHLNRGTPPVRQRREVTLEQRMEYGRNSGRHFRK